MITNKTTAAKTFYARMLHAASQAQRAAAAKLSTCQCIKHHIPACLYRMIGLERILNLCKCYKQPLKQAGRLRYLLGASWEGTDGQAQTPQCHLSTVAGEGLLDRRPAAGREGEKGAVACQNLSALHKRLSAPTQKSRRLMLAEPSRGCKRVCHQQLHISASVQ